MMIVVAIQARRLNFQPNLVRVGRAWSCFFPAIRLLAPAILIGGMWTGSSRRGSSAVAAMYAIAITMLSIANDVAGLSTDSRTMRDTAIILDRRPRHLPCSWSSPDSAMLRWGITGLDLDPISILLA